MREIFQNMTDKGLIFKMYKNPIQFNIKKYLKMDSRPKGKIFWRIHTDGQYKHEKILNTYLSENPKLKPQCNITSHMSEWLSSKRKQITNAMVWMWKKRILTLCWWECVLVRSLLKTVWLLFSHWVTLKGVTQKTKNRTNIWPDPEIQLLGIYPEKNNNTYFEEIHEP